MVCTVHKNISVIRRALIAGGRFGRDEDSEEQPCLINCLNLGILAAKHAVFFELSLCGSESGTR